MRAAHSIRVSLERTLPKRLFDVRLCCVRADADDLISILLVVVVVVPVHEMVNLPARSRGAYRYRARATIGRREPEPERFVEAA
jgi:hypothetical protein